MQEQQRSNEPRRVAEELEDYVVSVNERVRPEVFASAVRAVIALNRQALESLKDK